MLIESAIVAAAACLIGVVRAGRRTGSRRHAHLMDDPVLLDLRVDWRLVAFVCGLTVLSSALFGLAPALRASRVQPMTALKASGRRTSARAGAIRPFVMMQVAFS